MRETPHRVNSLDRAYHKIPHRSLLGALQLALMTVILMRDNAGNAMPPAEAHLPEQSVESNTAAPPFDKLIVIGFMGGNVSASSLVHREAALTRKLQQTYPAAIHAALFANRDGARAFDSILRLLSGAGDANVSEAQKHAARIVIFGHSWGASETIQLANRLNRIGVPVLLTIQVDSVQKRNQNDARIPPNVREAVNFFQAEGLLRGRTAIVAADPAKTTIVGNYESSYKQNPISCSAYPWYARAFMKRHIQIENDPAVWDRIEAMIVAKMI